MFKDAFFETLKEDVKYEGKFVEILNRGKKLYYVGEFLNVENKEQFIGEPHGNGVLFIASSPFVHVNGEIKPSLHKRYEGEFKNGRIYGEGKLYNSDGSLEYEGEFKNGKKHGTGKDNFGCVALYKDDKREGLGETMLVNCGLTSDGIYQVPIKKYIVEFKNDKIYNGTMSTVKYIDGILQPKVDKKVLQPKVDKKSPVKSWKSWKSWW